MALVEGGAELMGQHGQGHVSGSGGDRLRILISYHYFKGLDLEDMFRRYFTEPYPEVFLDSGAYSADTRGVPINLTEYMSYIERNRDFITTYSNLDVIRRPDVTWRNQQVMEDAGLRPIPVFHGGTSWAWLERYIDQYPYIALGGLVGKVQGAKGWLVRCFQMAKGRSVFHGYGVTSWQVLKDLPWYSVDSSSWGQGYRYGQVPLFDERKGRFIKVDLGDRREWARHSTMTRSLGFDPMDFADRSRNDRSRICAISALSYIKAERWLRKRHGEITIPGGDVRQSGLNLYLVDGSADNLSRADRGVKMYLVEGRTIDTRHVSGHIEGGGNP